MSSRRGVGMRWASAGSPRRSPPWESAAARVSRGRAARRVSSSTCISALSLRRNRQRTRLGGRHGRCRPTKRRSCPDPFGENSAPTCDRLTPSPISPTPCNSTRRWPRHTPAGALPMDKRVNSTRRLATSSTRRRGDFGHDGGVPYTERQSHAGRHGDHGPLSRDSFLVGRRRGVRGRDLLVRHAQGPQHADRHDRIAQRVHVGAVNGQPARSFARPASASRPSGTWRAYRQVDTSSRRQSVFRPRRTWAAACCLPS